MTAISAKGFNLFICVAGLLLVAFCAPPGDPWLLYPIALLQAGLFFMGQYEAFKSGRFLSFFAMAFLLVFLLMAVGVWKWGLDGRILHINDYTFQYLENGTLLRMFLLGGFSFLLGQHCYPNLKPVALVKAGIKSVSKAPRTLDNVSLVVFASCLVLYLLSYTFIFSAPYLSKTELPSELTVKIHNFWHILNTVSAVIVLSLRMQRGRLSKEDIVYVVSFSLLSFSFGDRGGGTLIVLSFFMLASIYGYLKIPYFKFLAGGLVAVFFLSFWGLARNLAHQMPMLPILKEFILRSNELGFSNYIYDSLPLVGQNLAHYASYMYLYDNSAASGWLPYLSGLLNLLPRELGLMLGLPVNPEYTHAIYLSNYVIHMGGSFLFGEPYWFGGFTAVVFLNFIYGWIFSTIDRYFVLKAGGKGFLGHYVLGVMLMTIGFGYGFSGFMRGLYILLVIEGILLIRSRKGSFLSGIKI